MPQHPSEQREIRTSRQEVRCVGVARSVRSPDHASGPDRVDFVRQREL
jgi:hypothetical protein